jgi:anti-sigma B factor antagonist
MAAEVKIESREGISLVDVDGTIDGASAPVVQERVLPLLTAGSKVVLDMQGVDFMSSAGLRLMLQFFRQTTAAGGKLVLLGLSEDIRDTMSLTGFLDFFTTAENMDAALAAVQG